MKLRLYLQKSLKSHNHLRLQELRTTRLNEAQAMSARVPKKRGTPPKLTTQPSSSSRIENALAKTQPLINEEKA
jgi:hypothetical protein